MVNLFIFSLLSSTIFYVCGSVFFLNSINKKQTLQEISSQSIYGIIFISLIALILNFFVPLTKQINSFFLVIFLFFFILYIKNKINLKKILFFSFLSGAFSFLLLVFSYIYNPDAGLYHYPYINILNNEKIILGLSNLHFRYGHISIIQYTSAFFNNFLFNINGIVIPLASLASFIILNFLFKILEGLNEKKINFHIIFLTLVLIYISYKMNRYSEYGNDAPAHFLFFFLISETLKNYNYNIIAQRFNLLLLSTFIFLNKITLGLVFLIPIALIKLKNFKQLNNISFYFSALLLLLWILKNIFVSGCLIYPSKITCIKKLDWTNITQTSKISIQSEAWSKGWSDRKNKQINMKDFNINFNWFDAWTNKHLKKINEILLPYVIFLIFIYLILTLMKTDKKRNKNIKRENKYNKKIILLISLLGCVFWFLKFPIYRYGYSYIIITIVIIFSTIFYDKITYLNFEKQKKIILFLTILSLSVLFVKQVTRIAKNYDVQYNNYPWPKYFSFSKNNNQISLMSKKINGKLIYKSDEYCMYSKAPCSHESINIKISKWHNYLIFK